MQFPAQPGPPSRPRPPAWPKAIGIISIVSAGIGLLCTPVVLAMQKAGPVRKAMKCFPSWYVTYSALSGIIGIAIAAVLLAAGIQTLRRRPSGSGLHITYAIVDILLSVAGIIVFVGWVIPQMDLSVFGPKQAGVIGGLVGGLIGMVAGMAYPMFLLVWFSRAKIRQQIRQWSAAVQILPPAGADY